MKTPRHLPRNTAARDLRERMKNESSFAKSLTEWPRIREEQRFRFEINETQFD